MSDIMERLIIFNQLQQLLKNCWIDKPNPYRPEPMVVEVYPRAECDQTEAFELADVLLKIQKLGDTQNE